MNLDTFTNKMHAEHTKLSGKEFDYTKIRFPWTEMTQNEIAYCTNDTQGLCEALANEMQADGDTLDTIPARQLDMFGGTCEMQLGVTKS